MSRTWGRLYAGTRNHRKIKILREEFPDHWTKWYVILELAIECDDEGWIYVSPGVPFTPKQLAKELGFARVKTSLTFLNALVTLQLATYNEYGLLVNSFSERNFESDTSTPRVKKYREKRREEQKETDEVKRFGNVSVTDQNRTETEHIQNRTEQIKKTPRKPKKSETPLPDDFRISEAVRTWATGKGFSRLDDHLESFKDYALSRGKTYADWDSAFKRAIREDWAKLSGNGGLPQRQHPQLSKADQVTAGNLAARERLLKKYQERGE